MDSVDNVLQEPTRESYELDRLGNTFFKAYESSDDKELKAFKEEQQRKDVLTIFILLMRIFHNVPASVADDVVRDRYTQPDNVMQNSVRYVAGMLRSYRRSTLDMSGPTLEELLAQVECLLWWAEQRAGDRLPALQARWFFHMPYAIMTVADDQGVELSPSQ